MVWRGSLFLPAPVKIRRCYAYLLADDRKTALKMCLLEAVDQHSGVQNTGVNTRIMSCLLPVLSKQWLQRADAYRWRRPEYSVPLITPPGYEFVDTILSH